MTGDAFKQQHPILYNIVNGITTIAEKTGIADKTREAGVQKKSETFENKVLNPVIDNSSLLLSNWQFVVIGVLALFVLLRD